MQKRLLSLFIALAMICSLFVFPASVFADMTGVSGNGEVCTLYKGDVKVDAVSGTITLKFNSDVDSDTILSILVYDDEKLQELGNEIAGLTGTVPGLYGDSTYESAMVYHSIKDYDDTATVFIPNAQENVFSIPIPQASWNRKLIVLSSSDQSAGVSAYFVTLDEDGNLVVPSGKITLDLDGGTLEGYDAAKGISVPTGDYKKADLLALISGTPTKANNTFAGWVIESGISFNDADPDDKQTVSETTEIAIKATYTAKPAFSGSLSIGGDSEFNGNSQKPTINGIAADQISAWYFDGTAANGKTNVGTYAVSVKIKEGTDYAETDNVTVGTWKITPATYTVDGDPAVRVNHGDSLKVTKPNAGTGGLAIVKDVKGNAVPGDIVINNGSSATADESHGDYTGQSWTFTAATTDSNYSSNTASGTNATITVNSRTAVTPTITGSSSTYDGGAIEEGADKDISVAFTGGTVGNNYELQFKNAATGGSTDTTFSNWTTAKPTHAGAYDVKVVLTGDAANSYKLADGTGTSTFTIEQKTVTVNTANVGKSKTYDGTNAVYKSGATTALAIGDLSITGVKTADASNVSLTGTLSAAYDKTDVTASKITISGLSLSGSAASDYKLTQSATITGASITRKSVTAALKGGSTKGAITYGSNAPTYEVGDFDYTGLVTGEAAATVLSGATFSVTGANTAAAGSDLAINVGNNGNVGNYSLSVTSKLHINKADYTTEAKEISISVGEPIKNNKTITVSADNSPVKDVAGNGVAGTLTLTVTDEVENAAANTTYPTTGSYTYSFTPTTANDNYNALTGATGVTLKTSNKTAVTGNLVVPTDAVTYGDDYTVTGTVTGFTEGTDFEVVYTKDGAESTTKPTDAGTYAVKLRLKGDKANTHEFGTSDTVTGTLVIKPKKVSVSPITFEKTYDGDTTAKKADGSEYAIADLSLADNTITGVNIVADGTFAATYDSADAANSVVVTISGVKLDNANYEIDGDSLEMTGKINPVEITATLNTDKATKTYGTAVTLDLATDFTITGTFVGADDINALAGAELKCDGLAEGAAVVDGGYAVKASKQPINTNYALTVKGTLTVEPKEISIVADAKTGLKYTGSAYGPADTVDVTPTGLVGTDTVSYKYTVAEGDILHPGTYNVTVALADAVKNYKLADNATAAVEIAKADYTPDVPFGDNRTVVADSDIVGVEYDATVTGADGNKVTGKYVITATNPAGPAVAGTEYTVEWKFVADTPNTTDYNDLTGTNKVTGTDEGSKLTITYAKGHYDGTEPTKDGFTTEVTKGDKLNVTGYKFGNVGDYKQVGWYDAAGNLVTGEVTINEDTTFTAAWEYKISVVEMKKDGTAKEPVEVTFTDSYASAPTASAINISADSADTGYEFTGWTAALSEGATGLADGTFAAATDLATTYTPAASAAYPISGTVTLTPNYAAKKYSITATAPTNGTYVVKVDGTEVTPVNNVIADVPYGSSIEVVPTPDEANGYTSSSVKVTDSTGTVKVENNGFKMPADNATITVTFSKPSRPSHGGGGGGGTTYFDVKYNAGTNGTITSGNASERVAFGGKPTKVPTITANDGYSFAGWSLDGTTVVDPTAQTVNKALTFTALYTDGSAPVQTPGTITDTDTHSAYVYGYPDGTFQAENGITRAETAAIFARALTDYVEGSAYSGEYSDVADDWYTNYVNFLSGRGVITGYEDGSFRPDNNITRREFTAMITRLGEVLEANGAGFPDVEDTDWAVNNIYTAAASGLVNGYEDGTFRPDNNITRAEAVKIVNAYLGRGVNEAGLANADYTTFPDVTTAHWAYYEIIEAANDHKFAVGTKPEVWTR